MLFLFSLQYIKIIKVQQSKALYPDKNFKLVTRWGRDSHQRAKGSLISWGQKHLFAHSVFSPTHCYAVPGESDQTPQAALLHTVTAEPGPRAVWPHPLPPRHRNRLDSKCPTLD